MTSPGCYRELSARLDAAFLDMESAWVEWRERRPNAGALNLYLQSLAECQHLHQLLKEFPQYEPFNKDFPTSPSRDKVGIGDSHGLSRHECVGGEGMDERTVLRGGGVRLCPRRLPLLGAAVPRRLAFGQPGGAGGMVRAQRRGARAAMTPEAKMLWVALATACALPTVATIIHLISKL
jgi:hypothetical protein